MTFKLVEYSDELDLKEFYQNALNEGAMNNTSKQVMVDCFKHENFFKGFVLYQDDKPVGFSACHSFDLMGEQCYRICARNYVSGKYRNLSSLSSVREIMEQHQNTTAQFFIPKFLEVLGDKCKMFITTNRSFVAKQRAVHSIYMPTLVKIGLAEKVAEDVEYRGHDQTIWLVDAIKLVKDLDNYPRWN